VEIAFRFVPTGRAERVDLLGEVSDWRNAVRLTRQDDGSFATTLDVPVGVYQYKLLVDGRWTLDEPNARTRSAGGQRNNLLVAGGAPEPLLFAAAPPWIEALDRGGVRVMVGVRKDAKATGVRVCYREDRGAKWSAGAAAHAFDEDEHTFFVATLPTSAQALELRIEAGATSFEARWTRPPASSRAASWWKDATLYTVFVDRFRPALDHGPHARPWDTDPGSDSAAGGHLDGVRRSLEHLAQLGVDALYLTPVHVGASAHRYDVVDPLTVDPALGGEAAYDALVRDARARGMRIVQDFSFAHAGTGFPAYDDVREHGRASRFAAYFVWKNDALVHYGKRTDAPLLDLENADVQELVLEAVAYWAKRGASALRLDMTAEVPLALGRRIRQRFRALVPDGIVLGEVVPQHAWRWRAEGVVDCATDFGFHEVISELICNMHASPATAFERLRRLDLLRGGDAGATAVRFLSTHDHPRLATRAAQAGLLARLPLAYALLATWSGIPMLLYGEELGLRSDGHARELEDVWPDRMPMPWAPGRGDVALASTVSDLLRARAGSRALRSGETTLLFADESTLVYRREADGEVVDVALNFAGEPKTLELDDDERPRMIAMATAGACEIAGAVVQLPAFGAIVARRERALGLAIGPGRARRNLALRDRELVDGRTVVEARPSRFFFSVTERCNLRCEHCITHAPELTKSGAARTMTPAVLDALRDDLGLATYFAFVHGGESLTTPILFEVLSAIRSARGAEPYVAHLLTNGLLLTARAAERLVGAGVSSISVSLDGATAATNDAIRVGGRFDDVRKNLEEVLAWRRAERVDLRLGLSFVVLQQNVGELDAFVELAADLGVDWVKLEEGVPATAFARRSLVSCTSRPVRDAVEAAVRRGRERGLVLVDHTLERAVWRCRLDAETSAFLAADEHANRSEIHPCRTPWETVCVEPNGDIRVNEFFGEILGNVTSAPLSQLWNGPAAIEARERMKLSRLCGPSGPVTCLPASARP
jgi:glycosidase/MoaA/NifB/PqqE/SkfB family radical SAM enzyme